MRTGGDWGQGEGSHLVFLPLFPNGSTDSPAQQTLSQGCRPSRITRAEVRSTKRPPGRLRQAEETVERLLLHQWLPKIPPPFHHAARGEAKHLGSSSRVREDQRPLTALHFPARNADRGGEVAGSQPSAQPKPVEGAPRGRRDADNPRLRAGKPSSIPCKSALQPAESTVTRQFSDCADTRPLRTKLHSFLRGLRHHVL